MHAPVAARRLQRLFGGSISGKEALAASAAVYLNFLSLTKHVDPQLAALRYLRLQHLRGDDSLLQHPHLQTRADFVPTRDISVAWASDLLRPTDMAVPRSPEGATSLPSWYAHQQLRLIQSGAVFERSTGQAASWLQSLFSTPQEGIAVTPATAAFDSSGDGIISSDERDAALREWMARYDATAQMWRDATGLRYRLPRTLTPMARARILKDQIAQLQSQLPCTQQSLEQLTAASTSQAKFSARVLKLGPGVVNNAWIDRAVERYQIFLEVARRNPGRIVVPTLDIDLIWHCHMLSPDDYVEDCTAILGKVLAHDAGHSSAVLEPSFETTQELWKEVTGEPMVADHKKQPTQPVSSSLWGANGGGSYAACGSSGFHLNHASKPHVEYEQRQIEEQDSTANGEWADDSIEHLNWDSSPASVWHASDSSTSQSPASVWHASDSSTSQSGPPTPTEQQLALEQQQQAQTTDSFGTDYSSDSSGGAEFGSFSDCSSCGGD